VSLVRRMQRRRQITRAEGGDQAGRRVYCRETLMISLGRIRAAAYCATIAAVGRVFKSPNLKRRDSRRREPPCIGLAFSQ
jgi:hypothetical protein